jgi:hypothetical protein
MAALYLFHLHYEPAGDHEAFRRRTDSCVAVAVESGRVEPACRALEGFDLAGVYGYVAHASDAEFERSLDAFR